MLQKCKKLTSTLYLDQTFLLGNGATGKVYLGYSLLQNTPIEVAVKRIPFPVPACEVSSFLLQCEKKALSVLKNGSNILKLIQIYEQAKCCYIATQKMTGGSLGDKFPCSQNQALNYLFQMLCGHLEMVKHGVIHRDIKPDNLMFKQDQIKFIDFGYCLCKDIKSPNTQYNVGSPRYMAPESYLRSQYSHSSDLFSIGVVFYQSLFGTTLDVGISMQSYFHLIEKEEIHFPKQITIRSKRIIKQLLKQHPKDRGNAEDIISLLNDFMPNKNLFSSHSIIKTKNQQEENRFQMQNKQHFQFNKYNQYYKAPIYTNHQQQQKYLQPQFFTIKRQKTEYHRIQNQLTSYLKQNKNLQQNNYLNVKEASSLRQKNNKIIEPIYKNISKNPQIDNKNRPQHNYFSNKLAQNNFEDRNYHNINIQFINNIQNINSPFNEFLMNSFHNTSPTRHSYLQKNKEFQGLNKQYIIKQQAMINKPYSLHQDYGITFSNKNNMGQNLLRQRFASGYISSNFENIKVAPEKKVLFKRAASADKLCFKYNPLQKINYLPPNEYIQTASYKKFTCESNQRQKINNFQRMRTVSIPSMGKESNKIKPKIFFT